jgi:hypothetical protein
MGMGKKWGMGRAIAADSAADDEVLCFAMFLSVPSWVFMMMTQLMCPRFGRVE